MVNDDSRLDLAFNERALSNKDVTVVAERGSFPTTLFGAYTGVDAYYSFEDLDPNKNYVNLLFVVSRRECIDETIGSVCSLKSINYYLLFEKLDLLIEALERLQTNKLEVIAGEPGAVLARVSLSTETALDTAAMESNLRAGYLLTPEEGTFTGVEQQIETRTVQHLKKVVFNKIYPTYKRMHRFLPRNMRSVLIKTWSRI